MKKKIVLILLAGIIAVSGCQVTMLESGPDPDKTAKENIKKAEAESLERIRRFKIIKEEKQLALDLLKLENEIKTWK